MASVENIFRRSRVIFGPDDKTGSDSSDQTSGEHPHQQAILAENSQFLDVDQLSTHFAPHSNALLELTFEVTNLKWRNLSNSYVIGKDDFNWEEDLSSNGQKLWVWLLNGNKIDFLEWIANEQGWDLNTAMDEIMDNSLLEECQPGYFRIIRRKL